MGIPAHVAPAHDHGDRAASHRLARDRSRHTHHALIETQERLDFTERLLAQRTPDRLAQGS